MKNVDFRKKTEVETQLLKLLNAYTGMYESDSVNITLSPTLLRGGGTRK